MYTCKLCGEQFEGDALTKGGKVHCPNCHTICEDVQSTFPCVCKRCGLACESADVKCPACGGDVVRQAEISNSDYEKQAELRSRKADSFKENFFWGMVLPYSCAVLLIALFALLSGKSILKKRSALGLLAGSFVGLMVLSLIGASLGVGFWLQSSRQRDEISHTASQGSEMTLKRDSVAGMAYTVVDVGRVLNGVPLKETIRRHNEIVAEEAKTQGFPIDGSHDPALEKYCSGGWGYDKDTAVVIDFGNHIGNSAKDGMAVQLEHWFVQRRAYEELGIYDDSAVVQRADMECLRFAFLEQSLRKIDGRTYDVLSYVVTGYPQAQLEILRNDMNEHDGYEDDPMGLARHQALASQWRIGYKMECWFDITSVMGNADAQNE